MAWGIACLIVLADFTANALILMIEVYWLTLLDTGFSDYVSGRSCARPWWSKGRPVAVHPSEIPVDPIVAARFEGFVGPREAPGARERLVCFCGAQRAWMRRGNHLPW